MLELTSQRVGTVVPMEMSMTHTPKYVMGQTQFVDVADQSFHETYNPEKVLAMRTELADQVKKDQAASRAALDQQASEDAKRLQQREDDENEAALEAERTANRYHKIEVAQALSISLTAQADAEAKVARRFKAEREALAVKDAARIAAIKDNTSAERALRQGISNGLLTELQHDNLLAQRHKEEHEGVQKRFEEARNVKHNRLDRVKWTNIHNAQRNCKDVILSRRRFENADCLAQVRPRDNFDLYGLAPPPPPLPPVKFKTNRERKVKLNHLGMPL